MVPAMSAAIATHGAQLQQKRGLPRNLGPPAIPAVSSDIAGSAIAPISGPLWVGLTRHGALPSAGADT